MNPKKDLVFYFLYDWSPHGQCETFSGDWYPQVVEMFPVEIKFDVEDLGNVSEGVDIIVPPVNLAFIQIRLAAQGEKE